MPRFGFDEIDEATAGSPGLHSKIDCDIVEEKVLRGFNQDNDAAYEFRIRRQTPHHSQFAARNCRASGPAADPYAARISRKRPS